MEKFKSKLNNYNFLYCVLTILVFLRYCRWSISDKTMDTLWFKYFNGYKGVAILGVFCCILLLNILNKYFVEKSEEKTKSLAEGISMISAIVIISTISDKRVLGSTTEYAVLIGLVCFLLFLKFKLNEWLVVLVNLLMWILAWVIDVNRRQAGVSNHYKQDLWVELIFTIVMAMPLIILVVKSLSVKFHVMPVVLFIATYSYYNFGRFVFFVFVYYLSLMAYKLMWSQDFRNKLLELMDFVVAKLQYKIIFYIYILMFVSFKTTSINYMAQYFAQAIGM